MWSMLSDTALVRAFARRNSAHIREEAAMSGTAEQKKNVQI
jgi:hypothetical protein